MLTCYSGRGAPAINVGQEGVSCTEGKVQKKDYAIEFDTGEAKEDFGMELRSIEMTRDVRAEFQSRDW